MTPSPTAGSARIMFSYGAGVDSAATLVQMIDQPDDIGVDLRRLVVVMAMTGDEYDRTRDLNERHILPLLRAKRIRFVQIARAGQSDSNRYEILSDTRLPTRMFMRGNRWRLSDEMRRNGVVPQVVRRRRLCSYRAKGQVLDWWAADEFNGQPFRHIIGFAAEETDRAATDTSYTSNSRNPWYPLIEWGWDRMDCEHFLLRRFGEQWSRSCCAYCPFQASKGGIDALCERWRREPDKARDALRLEWTAVALNPRSMLFGTRSARRVAIHAGLRNLVDDVDHELSGQPWAIYDVRRAFPAQKLHRDQPAGPGNRKPWAKGQGARSVTTLTTGRVSNLNARLARHGATVEGEHRIVRLWLARGGPPYPSRERFLVVAPAGVTDKTGAAFPTTWAAAHRRGHTQTHEGAAA